uniref:MARVEL domain-containing protein n=1 Tax=Strongyloides stercoralis TaxID=6248 RepID=A0A0K0DYJ6_STRER
MSNVKDSILLSKITTISIENDSSLDTIHEGVVAEITPTPLKKVSTTDDTYTRGRTTSFHLPSISEQGPLKLNEEELQKQYTRRSSNVSVRSFKPNSSKRPSIAPSIAFQHYDPKYKCMCESLHVAQGGIIICSLSALSILSMVLIIVFQKEYHLKYIIPELLILTIEAVAVFFLFKGLSEKKSKLILPFLILLIIGIFGLTTLCIFSIIVAIKPDNNAGNLLTSLTLENFSEFFSDDDYTKKDEISHSLSVIRMIAIFIAITTFFLIILESWFVWTLYKVYIYFKDIIDSEIRKAAKLTGGRRCSAMVGPRENLITGKRNSTLIGESNKRRESVTKKDSNYKRSSTAKPEFQAQKF